MCLHRRCVLNVQTVSVCVQLNREPAVQFVSQPVHVLPDRSSRSSGCWIKILAVHCRHIVHARNGLVNSACVWERECKRKGSESGLIGSHLSLSACSLTAGEPLHVMVTSGRVSRKLTPCQSTASQRDWRSSVLFKTSDAGSEARNWWLNVRGSN